MRRLMLALAAVVALALVATPAVAVEKTDCEVDRVIEGPDNRTVPVHVCDELGGQVGEYHVATVTAPENSTVTYRLGGEVVEPGTTMRSEAIYLEDGRWRNGMALTYIHELGHANGYNHSDQYDPVMEIDVGDNGGLCNPDPMVREVAANWSSVSINTEGYCHTVETPYGQYPRQGYEERVETFYQLLYFFG